MNLNVLFSFFSDVADLFGHRAVPYQMRTRFFISEMPCDAGMRSGKILASGRGCESHLRIAFLLPHGKAPGPAQTNIWLFENVSRTFRYAKLRWCGLR